MNWCVSACANVHAHVTQDGFCFQSFNFCRCESKDRDLLEYSKKRTILFTNH